jgi:SPP1 family predicted phage head-tail adaptor
MIRAGQLRTRATFQRPVRTLNDIGEEVVTYEDDFEASVSIKGIRGSMVENARQVAPEATHKVMLHYCKDRVLNESTRMISCGREYDIIFVDDVQLKTRFWELHVKQRKGAHGDQTGY